MQATLATPNSITQEHFAEILLQAHLNGLIVHVAAHSHWQGLEVSIRDATTGSRYRSGRSPDWLKFKNPEALAVKREAEEDWGR
jgi:hypothetical protein